MNRFAVGILSIAVTVTSIMAALTINFNGVRDTAMLRVCADSLYYTKGFNFTDGEAHRIVMKCSDSTSSAGLADDSIYYQWGYQMGCMSLDCTGVADTVWDNYRVCVDTMNADSITLRIGTVNTAGTESKDLHNADTSYLRGYVVQSRLINPPWNQLIRGWIKGLTGNKVGPWLKAIFDFKRKLFIAADEK